MAKGKSKGKSKEQVCRLYREGDIKGVCKHYIQPYKDNIGFEAGFCQQRGIFRCIEDLKKYLPTITQSSVKMFIQCRWKYYLNYILGIQCRKNTLPTPIKLGSIWDKFQEVYYESGEGNGDKGRFEEGFNIVEEGERYRLHYTEVAKLQALIRAYRKLGVKMKEDSGKGVCQYKVGVVIDGCYLYGFIDFAFEDGFGEVKLSANPDFHTTLENIYLQCGTYFLCNPEWDWVDMYVTRLPLTRTGGNGQYSDESFEDYRYRVYSDIIKRPAYYFIGYDRKKRVYGKRFYRGEFDLEDIEDKYRKVIKDMRHCIDEKLWYENELSCWVPAPCQYLPVRKSRVISEEIYEKLGDNEEEEKLMR